VAGVAAADSSSGRYRLVLPAALSYRVRQPGQSAWANEQRDVALDLAHDGTNWEAGVWAFIPTLPGQEHPGRVTGSRTRGARGELTAAIYLRDNAQAPASIGGTAEVTLRWRRDGNNLSGGFRIVSKGRDSPETRASLRSEWAAPSTGFHPRPADVDRLLTECLTDGETEGEIAGVVEPAFVRGAPGSPYRAGQHPRLFYDAEDLDRLRKLWSGPTRERLLSAWYERIEPGRPPANPSRTGRGGALPAAAMQAAAAGLLFHLGDDAGLAEWARDVCWYAMVRDPSVGWHTAEQLAGVAICYDSFHGVWDARFREVVRLYLERQSRQISRLSLGPRFSREGEGASFIAELSCGWPGTSADTWFTRYRAAAGLAALAILNDPPARAFAEDPPDPEAAPMVAPSSDGEPPFGVPVGRFRDGEIPDGWLVNGPFFTRENDPDPLAAIGGRAGARPCVGTAVEHRGVALEFRRLVTGEPSAYVFRSQGQSQRSTLFHRVSDRRDPWGQFNPQWDYSTGLGGYEPAARVEERGRQPGQSGRKTLYLYAVLRNEAARSVRFDAAWQAGCPDIAVWLNGREMHDGDVVRIVPGLYPMLVELPIAWNPFDPAPRLTEYTEDDRRRRDEARVRSRAESAFGPPGLTPALANERVAARWIRRFIEKTVDGAGWSPIPAFYADALELALPYLIAHRRVLGEDLASGTGVERLAGLAALLGTNEFQHVGLAGVALPLAFPLAVGTGREWAVERLASTAQGLPIFAETWRGLPVLASYPIVWPASSSAERSRAMLDRSPGSRWFRCATSLGDAVLGIVSEPGAFVLSVAGQAWAAGATNAVTLHGLQATGAATTVRLTTNGQARIFEARCDYRLTSGGSKRAATGQRWIAMDGTGASGAPLLIAVADRISDAPAGKAWWQMDAGGAGASAATTVEMEGPGFAVRRLDAGGMARGTWLRVSVVRPDPAAIWMDLNGGGRGTGRGPHRASRGALVRMSDRAPTADPPPAAASEPRKFLAVLTLQDGPAPSVQARERDGSIRVEVGKRVLVFDANGLELSE
jgi:hypothetical protein